MAFWDYGVKEGDGNALAGMAAKLGIDGMCIFSSSVLSGKIFVKGILITEKNPEMMKRAVKKNRKAYAVIAVSGTDEKMNRIATETEETDILIPCPETKIDFVMAKTAKKNNVRIAFDFSELLHSTLVDRGRIFSQMVKNAQCVRKAGAPFMIISGAESEFGLRSQSEFISFGKLLGFDEASVKKATSSALIDENRKRLSGKWISPGVEVDK
ncbi:MAG: hypothetical protein JW789_01925 [Candidatus Aenigmarchaeota archaeon]|nr:hypothetical protein [Candidatus Aenigmarchaeota archaeon]